jgi:hypothetical protein
VPGPSMLEGECACKSVRYRLNAAPMFVHCCHCTSCQRQTGSAFVINAVIEKDNVELLSGDVEPVDVPRDNGTMQRVMRCPKCKIAVWSFYTYPRMAFVRTGTLDVPSSVTPDVHIYTRSKLPWVTLPPSVPAFEVFYDPKTLWPAESQKRAQAVMG